jgi:peptidoglycan/LPS O-acetylase OafA/YrhL
VTPTAFRSHPSQRARRSVTSRYSIHTVLSNRLSSSSPPAPRRSAPQSHIPALDGVRAIAIVAVFAYHTIRTNHAEGPISKVLVALGAGGWMGVDMFFVLSGFLITGILLDTRGAEGYFRTFALRRALRILPLYYVALIALLLGTTLMTGAAGVEGAALRSAQGWYWTHLANVLVARDGFPGAPLHTGHFWSLAVEEQFYLVWPLVVAACSIAVLRRVCVAMVGIALAVRFALVWHAGTDVVSAAYVLPFARLDPLAIGAWLAIAARQPGALAAAWPRVRVSGAIALVVLAAVVVRSRSLQWGPMPMQTVGYSAVALLAAVLLVLAVRATGRLFRVLTLGPITLVGRRSYALYLIHYPLIALAGHAGISGDSLGTLVGSQVAGLLLWMVTLFAISLALAEMTWRTIERPCLMLKERIAGRPSRAEIGRSGSAPRASPAQSAA